MKEILVVDNDRMILEFMNELLSDEGYNVLTAEDGLSAVDMLKTYTPDAIFVDLVMPNIDGKRLCKIIRGMEKLKDVYLIILSATVGEEDIDVAELGVNTCIAKGPLNEMAQNVLDVLLHPELASSRCLAGEIIGDEGTSRQPIWEELISIKRHFETIFESMSEGILELTKNGRIVYANPAAISLIDRPETKLLGSHFTESFAEDFRKPITNLIETSDKKAGRVGQNSPISLNHRLVMLKTLPIHESKSTIIILNDITEQKLAEDTLLRRNRELELLNQSSHALNSSLDLDQVLNTVLEEIRRLMEVAGSTIWLYEKETGELTCRQATGLFGKKLEGWSLSSEEGFVGWVARHEKSLIVADTRTDSRHYKGIDVKAGVEMRSILGTPLKAKKQLIGVLQVVDTEPSRFENTDQSLLEWVAASAAVAIENAWLYERAREEISVREKAEAELHSSLNKIRSTLSGTIQAIAMIVERRDPYTAGHQRRVADLGRAVAEEMGLTEDQIEGVGVSGIIHDIGKIAVPAEILSKPGALDPEEFLLIKKHPQVGYDVLRGIEFPWPIAEIVLQHHERLNGTGYPHGLSGEEILVEARILCVSDVVEAMASHRPYRAALGIHKALEEIEQKRGIAYDTDVVEACSRVLREKGFEFE